MMLCILNNQAQRRTLCNNLCKLLLFVLLSSLCRQSLSQETGKIVATGFGTVDTSAVAVKGQAKLMAKRAALLDAQRNLAEEVKGFRLTGGTTLEDFEVSSDIVATRVKALLKGAFEIDSKFSEMEDSVVAEVTLAICVDNSSPSCRYRQTLLDLFPEKQPDTQ